MYIVHSTFEKDPGSNAEIVQHKYTERPLTHRLRCRAKHSRWPFVQTNYPIHSQITSHTTKPYTYTYIRVYYTPNTIKSAHNPIDGLVRVGADDDGDDGDGVIMCVLEATTVAADGTGLGWSRCSRVGHFVAHRLTHTHAQFTIGI